MNNKTIIILEGGALRSLFTCGVLDVFMKHDIYFPNVGGVSAGAMCAISYISKQIGRTAKINFEFANDKRYMSMQSLIKNKMLFNFDFLFGEVTYELVPLDIKTLTESEQNLFVFTTDCSNGKSYAFEKGKCDDILLACRASSSMPLLSPMVKINGKNYLDGGVADPIPYKWALENGYEKIVLILTRDITYRKKEQSKLLKKLYASKFKNYPELVSTMCNIPTHYNELADEIQDLEKQKKIFVIRPDEPVKVKRAEKDVEKLKELYEIGRKTGENILLDLQNYLEN